IQKPGFPPADSDDSVRPLHEVSLAVQYVTLALVAISITLSTLCAIKVFQVAKIVVHQNPGVGDVLKKLTAHSEAKKYFGTKPSVFVRVDPNNLEMLSRQFNGMDVFWIGNHVVVYGD